MDVFSFIDGQANLYSRNQKIHLSQWYDNMIPTLQHFLFIKNTEELCFVEKSGRARIYSLIHQHFRLAVCNLPSNTANVLSSPDGSCIVAFVKEKLYDKFPNDNVNNDDEQDYLEDNDDDSIYSKDIKEINNSIKSKEICRAHVYFCANFGNSASKG